jgi:hypothetical protein
VKEYGMRQENQREPCGAWKVLDDTSFATFILSLDEHLQLFWRVLKLSRPKRSLIETFHRSGLQQKWENLGSVGRDSVWEKVWRGTFDGSLPPLLSRREADEVFALFMRNRFLGAILVLEEFRVRKRDDAFELVNAVQGAWGRDPVLRQLIALTERRMPRRYL